MMKATWDVFCQPHRSHTFPEGLFLGVASHDEKGACECNIGVDAYVGSFRRQANSGEATEDLVGIVVRVAYVGIVTNGN